MPSEEHIFRQGTVEPAFDEMTGNLTYILTPDAPMNANPAAWAPLYIPVYPLSAAASLGTHNCMHVPADNCPDRGPGVAAGAAALQVLEFGHRLGGRHRFLTDQPLATKAVPRLSTDSPLDLPMVRFLLFGSESMTATPRLKA